MKNRRFALIAFLLCATLIVSVGYAAVSETLTIEGSASYNVSSDTGLDGVIQFTGNHMVVNSNHTEIEADEIIVGVTYGSQKATIEANFSGGTDGMAKYINGSQYLVGIIFEVEINNSAEGATDLVLAFDEIAINGEVGLGQPFTVESHIKDGTTNSATDLTGNYTVAAGATEVVYLHVQISMPDTIVTGGADIADTPFTVTLPVQQVEEVGA